MPVILSQHFSPADRVYADAEGALYHYPRQYFTRIKPYDSFVYYRPLGESTPRADSKTYFGYGILGMPFPDVDRPDHRFVPIIAYERFPRLVPLKDPLSNYYETGSSKSLPAQSAVRVIGEVDFHRILAAAGVAHTSVASLPSREAIAAISYVGKPLGYPKDDLRKISEIPPGAGYRPHGDQVLDVYESAALQERARADHQHVLKLIAAAVHDRGGNCWYNNNIDLFTRVGEQPALIEAKSLGDVSRAVDRMRYGIGQLTDYGIRYREDVGRAIPVLAFGRPPDQSTSWVSRVLQEANIAFVAADGAQLLPLNDRARDLRFIA